MYSVLFGEFRIYESLIYPNGKSIGVASHK